MRRPGLARRSCKTSQRCGLRLTPNSRLLRRQLLARRQLLRWSAPTRASRAAPAAAVPRLATSAEAGPLPGVLALAEVAGALAEAVAASAAGRRGWQVAADKV